MFEVLIIVVDHQKGFVGSRVINDQEIYDNQNYMNNFLNREFPGIIRDDVLFFRNNKLIAEWFRGAERFKEL